MSAEPVINKINHEYFKRIVHGQTAATKKKERVLRQLYKSLMSYYILNYDLRNDIFRSLLLDEFQLVTPNHTTTCTTTPNQTTTTIRVVRVVTRSVRSCTTSIKCERFIYIPVYLQL